MRVVVTGADGAIGRTVVRRLVADPTVFDVLAVDRVKRFVAVPGAETKNVDLVTADLASVFSGADSVVHLATTTSPATDDAAAADLEIAIMQRVLAAVAEAGVGQVLLLSTAMVYGAWEGNPIPLTEEAPIRPNPDFAWAVVRASVEQVANEWATGRPDTAVAILRPTAVVVDDDLGRLATVLHAARSGVAAVGDPPVQYLHVEDLAAAVAVAVTERLDGAANVAPDGWIPPADLNDLEGPKARIRVPVWMARAFSAMRWRFGLSPASPGAVAYTTNPWVVANDRMRSLGWRAEYSNEEAWVVSHEPGPLDRLPARRRQEIALAVAVIGVGAVVGAVGYALWRLRRD